MAATAIIDTTPYTRTATTRGVFGPISAHDLCVDDELALLFGSRVRACKSELLRSEKDLYASDVIIFDVLHFLDRWSPPSSHSTPAKAQTAWTRILVSTFNTFNNTQLNADRRKRMFAVVGGELSAPTTKKPETALSLCAPMHAWHTKLDARWHVAEYRQALMAVTEKIHAAALDPKKSDLDVIIQFTHLDVVWICDAALPFITLCGYLLERMYTVTHAEIKAWRAPAVVAAAAAAPPPLTADQKEEIRKAGYQMHTRWSSFDGLHEHKGPVVGYTVKHIEYVDHERQALNLQYRRPRVAIISPQTRALVIPVLFAIRQWQQLRMAQRDFEARAYAVYNIDSYVSTNLELLVWTGSRVFSVFGFMRGAWRIADALNTRYRQYGNEDAGKADDTEPNRYIRPGDAVDPLDVALQLIYVYKLAHVIYGPMAAPAPYRLGTLTALFQAWSQHHIKLRANLPSASDLHADEKTTDTVLTPIARLRRLERTCLGLVKLLAYHRCAHIEMDSVSNVDGVLLSPLADTGITIGYSALAVNILPQWVDLCALWIAGFKISWNKVATIAPAIKRAVLEMIAEGAPWEEVVRRLALKPGRDNLLSDDIAFQTLLNVTKDIGTYIYEHKEMYGVWKLGSTMQQYPQVSLQSLIRRGFAYNTTTSGSGLHLTGKDDRRIVFDAYNLIRNTSFDPTATAFNRELKALFTHTMESKTMMPADAALLDLQKTYPGVAQIIVPDHISIHAIDFALMMAPPRTPSGGSSLVDAKVVNWSILQTVMGTAEIDMGGSGVPPPLQLLLTQETLDI